MTPVLLGLGLLVSACGSSSSAPKVDSVGATTSTTSGSSLPGAGASSSPTGSNPAALQFAECMRSHGVPAFPDPVNGRIQIHVVNGQGLDPNSPQFQAAQQKCLKLVPGFHLGGTAGQTAGQQSALLKFAACMQTHGEPNFPDPKFSGGGVEFELPGINPNSPQYGSAYKACQSDLPTGMQFGASSGS